MELAVHIRTNRRLRWGLLVALLAIAGVPVAGRFMFRSSPPGALAAPAAHAAASLPITAPGRIEPKDGVLTIAAPASLAGPAIVTRLHVRQGDWVREGQLLATLRGRDELQATLVARERARAIARARLAALTSGGKEDDLRVLRADVQRDEAALAHVDAETRRSKQLHEYGLLDTASLQAQESRLAIAVRALEASRARLNGLSSVRPADVAVADAELRAADADVDHARSTLEGTIVRAPCDGRVLAVYAQPGQGVGADGVLALGKTSEMFVDAEVMEEDLARAGVGQKVRITGDVLSGAMEGTVEEIGVLVGSREIFKTDPTAFADSRVVHVKIRAADPARLARFINARVTAVIQPQDHQR
jgi:HlyD family secretion protein